MIPALAQSLLKRLRADSMDSPSFTMIPTIRWSSPVWIVLGPDKQYREKTIPTTEINRGPESGDKVPRIY